jgi:bifunctional DNA-binding transcriptional regulator/antitoxin component of YhaV-PrlF toxin-antitoxin module
VLVRKVTASAKGQFTIPADVFRALGGHGPMELLLVQEGGRVVLMPAAAAGKRIVDDLGGWSALSAQSLNDLWDNEADEVWDDA